MFEIPMNTSGVKNAMIVKIDLKPAVPGINMVVPGISTQRYLCFSLHLASETLPFTLLVKFSSAPTKVYTEGD